MSSDINDLRVLMQCFDKLEIEYTVRTNECSLARYDYVFIGERRNINDMKDGKFISFNDCDIDRAIAQHNFFEFEDGNLVSYSNSQLKVKLTAQEMIRYGAETEREEVLMSEIRQSGLMREDFDRIETEVDDSCERIVELEEFIDLIFEKFDSSEDAEFLTFFSDKFMDGLP